jgi:hypothetical protein
VGPVASDFDSGAVVTASENGAPGGGVGPPPPGVGNFDEAGERKALIELYGKALENFDRAVVVISGGALAVSVTFLEKLAPHPVVASLNRLWIGWIGLAISLSSIILSMLAGHRALEDALEGKGLTNFTTLTTVLNFVAGVALVVGLLGLAAFAATNAFASAK